MISDKFSKVGFLFSFVAVLLCGFSLSGIEHKMLAPKVKSEQVFAPYKSAADKSGKVVKKVNSWTLSPYNGAYILEDVSWALLKSHSEKGEVDSGYTDESVDLETIHLSGIFEGNDGYEALVNGSRVREGGVVYGYKMLELTENKAVFDVNGKQRTLKINGEISVPQQTAVPLTLDAVRERSGAWEAVINGLPYKVGDWVDSETQIRAVMPGKVMVFRGGTLKVLVLSE